jgi:hypothetical protein
MLITVIDHRYFQTRTNFFFRFGSCTKYYGTFVALKTNYFKLIQRPTFEFTQYRVDFEPDIEHGGMRKAFVRQRTDTLRGHVFDGQSIESRF